MLIVEAVLILLYFIAQVLDVAAGAISWVDQYAPVIFIISVLALSVIAVFATKKWPVLKRNNINALGVGHLLLYGAIFVSYGKFETHYANMGASMYDTTFSISFLNRAFVFAIALASAFCLPAVLNASFMQKYFSKNYLISVGIISAYAAFAAIGDSLFFQNHFSFVTLIVYLMGVLWVFPMTLQVLALYELICSRLQRNDLIKTHSNRFVWLTTFGVFMAVWLVYLIAYNPAQMSGDSIGMWVHAISGEKIGYLNFPTLVIFLARLITYIIPHPMFIVIVQIILFAALGSFFMLEFYKRGISLRGIYIFAGSFAALPPTGLMITTLWSNIPYTMSLLYLTYAIFRLLSPDKGKVIPYINIALALALTYSTRYEGFISAILCILLLLYLSFRKRINVKILVATAMGCVLIFLTQGPLYKAITIDDEANLSVEWMTLMDGIQGVVYYDGSLPVETQEFMESMMPLDEWKDRYFEYDMNTDHFPDELKARAKQNEFLTEMFEHYLNTLKQEPFLLIKNRLAKSNLVWDMTQPKGSYNERCMTWTGSGEIGFPHQGNFLEVIISKVAYPFTIALAPLDMLLYRSGIYIVFSLILCVFLMSRGSFKVSMLFLPVLGGIIALLIAMGWPCFRTVWFIPVIFTFVAPLILAQAAREPKDIPAKKILRLSRRLNRARKN